jgi:putative membrane protein
MKNQRMVLTVAAALVLAGGQVVRAQDASANRSQDPDAKSAAGPASASSASAGGASEADKKFVMKAAQGGLAEVKLGQLAQDHASSEDVKKFGQLMVDDHSKANDQLKQIAQSKGIQVPDAVDPKDQALYDKLSALKGTEFDRAYSNAMRKDHRKDVAEFRKQSQKGQDSDIKGFASTTLPTLESHLKMAEALGMAQEKATSANKGTVGGDQGMNTDNTGAMPADQGGPSSPGSRQGNPSGPGYPQSSPSGPPQRNPR